MPFPRHSPRTCNSKMYEHLSSMHEHTKSCECVIQMMHNDAGTLMNDLCVCALTPCKRKKNLDTLASN